jgi:hypothetical protein
MGERWSAKAIEKQNVKDRKRNSKADRLARVRRTQKW